jgi:hypothetical protein
MVSVVCAHRYFGGWLIVDTGTRMGVDSCPRGDGARLLSERSPVRAIALLRHWAAVPRGGTLRRALRIRAGRPPPRSLSHRRAGALVPCPMCGDSLGQVPEESLALPATVVWNEKGPADHCGCEVNEGNMPTKMERNPGKRKAAAWRQRLNCWTLIPLFANLFPSTLLRQSLLHSALLARLEVVRVPLHVLNDVFRLNLALETAEGVL